MQHRCSLHPYKVGTATSASSLARFALRGERVPPSIVEWHRPLPDLAAAAAAAVLPPVSFLSHHVQRGSVALSTVLRAGWLSYAKCDFSTPRSSAPNGPIKLVFGTSDYDMEITISAKLLGKK